MKLQFQSDRDCGELHTTQDIQNYVAEKAN